MSQESQEIPEIRVAVEPGSRRAGGDWSELEGPRALAVGRRDPRMCCAGRWSSRSLALPTGGRESCVWKRLASSRSPRYQPNVVGPRLVVEPVFVGTGGFLATAPRFYLERLHWGPTTHRGNIEGMMERILVSPPNGCRPESFSGRPATRVKGPDPAAPSHVGRPPKGRSTNRRWNMHDRRSTPGTERIVKSLFGSLFESFF